jgi:hypothetical protein
MKLNMSVIYISDAIYAWVNWYKYNKYADDTSISLILVNCVINFDGA